MNNEWVRCNNCGEVHHEDNNWCPDCKALLEVNGLTKAQRDFWWFVLPLVLLVLKLASVKNGW